MLFDHVGLAQIVVHGDAGVVDEDIQSVDLADCPLDMLGVGDVQRQGVHPFIRMLKWAASSRINPLCSSFQRLFDECPTDASVRAGNQDCLIFDVHTILLHDLCSSFAITHRSAAKIRPLKNKSCVYPNSTSKRRTSALTLLRFRLAHRHMPLSGSMIVLPS